ncbi:MAG: hypothetical protein AVDCRST_MAG73-2192, partial [uncultured Thermomicrobiales bacterium]
GDRSGRPANRRRDDRPGDAGRTRRRREPDRYPRRADPGRAASQRPADDEGPRRAGRALQPGDDRARPPPRRARRADRLPGGDRPGRARSAADRADHRRCRTRPRRGLSGEGARRTGRRRVPPHHRHRRLPGQGPPRRHRQPGAVRRRPRRHRRPLRRLPRPLIPGRLAGHHPAARRRRSAHPPNPPPPPHRRNPRRHRVGSRRGARSRRCQRRPSRQCGLRPPEAQTGPAARAAEGGRGGV